MRSGVIARKLGMTRVFNDVGRHVPETVLKLDDVRSNLFLCKMSLGCGERLSCCCNNSTMLSSTFGTTLKSIP